MICGMGLAVVFLFIILGVSIWGYVTAENDAVRGAAKSYIFITGATLFMILVRIFFAVFW